MSYGKIQGYRELRKDTGGTGSYGKIQEVQGATGRYKGYRELREDTRGKGATGRYRELHHFMEEQSIRYHSQKVL